MEMMQNPPYFVACKQVNGVQKIFTNFCKKLLQFAQKQGIVIFAVA